MSRVELGLLRALTAANLVCFFFVVVVFIPGKRSFCHEYIQFLPKKKGAGILEQSKCSVEMPLLKKKEK